MRLLFLCSLPPFYLSPLGNTLPRTHCRLDPHKANELLPDIRKSKTVRLHLESLRQCVHFPTLCFIPYPRCQPDRDRPLHMFEQN
ncbi:hypothetical protein B0F90DRAFT_1805547 [Multifurca ochricompacta]|uniref:Uncharacterized protein n=1 Tax=Multifurca ochricompacta TaxID=376703 RepID=A0AAD4LTU0_9AGAM|nr:hypothetical protein B0F90DRAFT_1805547 [Multifurca ochricompacta]